MLGNLLKVIQLVSSGARIQTQACIIPESSIITTILSQKVVLSFLKVWSFHICRRWDYLEFLARIL